MTKPLILMFELGLPFILANILANNLAINPAINPANIPAINPGNRLLVPLGVLLVLQWCGAKRHTMSLCCRYLREALDCCVARKNPSARTTTGPAWRCACPCAWHRHCTLCTRRDRR